MVQIHIFVPCRMTFEWPSIVCETGLGVGHKELTLTKGPNIRCQTETWTSRMFSWMVIVLSRENVNADHFRHTKAHPIFSFLEIQLNWSLNLTLLTISNERTFTLFVSLQGQHFFVLPFFKCKEGSFLYNTKCSKEKMSEMDLQGDLQDQRGREVQYHQAYPTGKKDAVMHNPFSLYTIGYCWLRLLSNNILTLPGPKDPVEPHVKELQFNSTRLLYLSI